MIKTLKYTSIIAFALAVGISPSCSREEDEIFDQSAAERLSAAESADYELLCSATNGWEMLYFPSNTERGYNFLMKFELGNKVTIAARNQNTGDAYMEETSAFDVIGDNGPVLTFNTYNSLFHRYSDPNPNPSDPNQVDLGRGSNGDYEFKIMSASSDVIVLRGKKHGMEVYMYPLADDVSWTQYFDDVYAMHDKIFNSKIPELWLTLADGVRFSIGDGWDDEYYPNDAQTISVQRDFVTDQVMGLLPEGGDPEIQTTSLSYIVTRNGIRWAHTFPGDTITTTPAREFVMNDEGTYLVSTDFGGEDCTAGATIKAPSLADLFPLSSWSLDVTSMTGNIAAAYQTFIDGFNSSALAAYDLFGISFGVSSGNPALCVTFGPNETSVLTANFYYTYTVAEDGSMTFAFDGQDNNGGVVINNVPQMADFITILESTTFSLSSSSELNPTRIMFGSGNNGNFCVDLQ